MSKGKHIRVFEYVNHPYGDVRELLTADAGGVFSRATKSAARRARSIASELRVNVGGIEIGTDIDIRVTGVGERPKRVSAPEATVIGLEWEASKMPHLFPFMRAELSVYPLTATETQLELEGAYEPPLGPLGGMLDDAVGHRIAEASVHRFIRDVALHLRAELGDEAGAGEKTT